MRISNGTTCPARRANSTELAILGVIWLAIAAVFAVELVAAPIAATLAAVAAHSFGVGAAGLMIVLTMAVPACFAVAGAARIRQAVSLALEAQPVLPLRSVMAEDGGGQSSRPLSLADGRAVPEVAIGRFGAAVFRQIPGDAAVRRFGNHFEFQVDGQWIPFDEPTRRAAAAPWPCRSLPGRPTASSWPRSTPPW